MVWCARNRPSQLRAAGALLALAAGFAGLCHAGTDVVPQAESALRAKLQAAYPGVDRWKIDLLPQEWQASARLAREHVEHPVALVTRLGPQSAVWVGTSAGVEAPRGAVLWFQVAGYGPALVASHLIPSGLDLQAADAGLAERNVLAAACQPVVSPELLRGMRAVRLIRAGEVICTDAIGRMPSVVRGEQVTAHFAAQGVEITARVTAESDGFVGGPVTVRSPRGDEITATVTGKREVSVNE
jgi:flagella basal body P-ring formation protein FlgA